MLTVNVQLWEDGAKHDRDLEELDRWVIQAAEVVTLSAADLSPLTFRQNLRLLSAQQSGVGAVLWESAFVLAAHLAGYPDHSFVGCKVVELGCGLGLAGIVLAQLGAHVTLTDLDKVIDLTQKSIVDNGLCHRRHGKGFAEAVVLDWAAASNRALIDSLTSTPLDLVVAADSSYDDQDGTSPEPSTFFETCKALCTRKTMCILAVERRRQSTYNDFMAAANRSFTQVSRLPHPKGALFDKSRHVELWQMQSQCRNDEHTS